MRAILCFVISSAVVAAPPSSVLLTNANGENQRFASVGRLQAGLTCTGTWIDPNGASGDAPAYFLTAGHCVSLAPQVVIIDRVINGTITFNYFVDTTSATIPIRAVRAVWSTMKNADLAVLELASTNAELRSQGLTPHRLAATSPIEGAPLHWVGAPTTFIPSGPAFLRRGQCSALGATPLIEGSWQWFDDIRNDCPDLYASASGSPLFDQNEAIVGVIGTTTLLSLNGGPDYDCFQNRPCAVKNGAAAVERDTSYASPVFDLAGCFTNGRFDLSLPTCGLDPGVQLTLDAQRVTATQPVVDGQPARWNVRLTGALAYYAWKQLEFGQGDCRDSAGYSTPVALNAAPVIEAELPQREGQYLLCVVAGSSPVIDGSWQSFRHPSILRRTVDATPLSALPAYTVTWGGIAYRLEVDELAPAVGTVLTKRGTLSDVDCADPADYRLMLSVPPVIRPSDFPHRICMWLADTAANWSPPMVFDFGPPSLQPLGLRNPASFLRVKKAARGSLIRVETIELTSVSASANPPVAELGGIRAALTDASGARQEMLLNAVDRTYVEALMPDGAALGSATITILPANLSIPVQVVDSSPGFFTANLQGFGPPLGYYQFTGLDPQPLFNCANASCSEVAIPVSRAGGPVDLTLAGTGFSKVPVQVFIGTEEVEVIESAPNPDWLGVDGMRVRIPADFGLRGYQLLRIGQQYLRLLLQ